MRAKFKVPAYNNLNKALLFEAGAQIGVDLALPDGSIPNLQQLAAALAPYLSSSTSASTVNSVSTTLWSLIQEKPPNIVSLASMSGTGVVRREGGVFTADAALADLADVSYPTGTPAPGDVLTFDSGVGWIPAPPSGGGGGSSYPAPQLLIAGVF